MGWDLDIFLSHFYVKFGFLNFLERVMIQDNFSNGTELPLLVFNLFVKFFFFFKYDFPLLYFFWTFSFLISVVPALLNFGSTPRSFPQGGALFWKATLVVRLILRIYLTQDCSSLFQNLPSTHLLLD